MKMKEDNPQPLTVPPLMGRMGLRPNKGGVSQEAISPRLSNEYKERICKALDTPEDHWGQEILERPEGPTYENMKDLISPIMYGVNMAVNGSFLTDTGVYYIPFGQPETLTKLGDVALTVADGSQIISNRVNTLSTRIFVGAKGEEQFGSCLANLSTPVLYRKYLPILELDYVDHEGVQYHQESFATFIPGTNILASFVEITAIPGNSANPSATIQIEVCDNNNLRLEGNQLLDDRGQTHIYFSPGCTFYNTILTYPLNFEKEGSYTVYFIRPVTPTENAPKLIANQTSHLKARAASVNYWEKRLSESRCFFVPEDRVMDAQHSLIIQNLLMTWRYSLGNGYQAFYQPESSGTVSSLGRFGFTSVYRQALQDLLPISKGMNRRSWEYGEKLSHSADYYWLTRDVSLIKENREVYIKIAEDLAAQHAKDPNHLLERQQYSSDVKDYVYGLHQNAMAVYGLQSMVSVWNEIGDHELVDRFGPISEAFRKALEKAVQKSAAILPDGSLFTPVYLLGEEEKAYEHLSATYLGSYWNLVAQFAFGALLYPPGSKEAKATLQYLYKHGSRLLGQLKVRDGAINNVYAVEQAKFLADNDQPDQLVLSFYGHLAHGMTRNTHIGGEAANVGPLACKWPKQLGGRGKGKINENWAGEVDAELKNRSSFEEGWALDEYYRGIYLSPNSANNSFFLKLLRLMLIHEITNQKGEPQSLQLGFFTPRAWLEDGKRIQVFDAPTLFGSLSYEIQSHINRNEVEVYLEPPVRDKADSLRLRLRVPTGNRLTRVRVNGHPHEKFEAATETIDLSGINVRMRILAYYEAEKA